MKNIPFPAWMQGVPLPVNRRLSPADLDKIVKDFYALVNAFGYAAIGTYDAYTEPDVPLTIRLSDYLREDGPFLIAVGDFIGVLAHLDPVHETYHAYLDLRKRALVLPRILKHCLGPGYGGLADETGLAIDHFCSGLTLAFHNGCDQKTYRQELVKRFKLLSRRIRELHDALARRENAILDGTAEYASTREKPPKPSSRAAAKRPAADSRRIIQAIGEAQDSINATTRAEARKICRKVAREINGENLGENGCHHPNPARDRLVQQVIDFLATTKSRDTINSTCKKFPADRGWLYAWCHRHENDILDIVKIRRSRT